MGFENRDWLRSFNKDCDTKSYSKSKKDCDTDKSCSKKDCDTDKTDCTKSTCSESSSCSKSNASICSNKCVERVFHNKCHEDREQCVIDKRRKVVHEKICKIRHINKVYIQPVCRTIHSKKTMVYRLPTKYIDEGCQKDFGVEYVNCCRPRC